MTKLSTNSISSGVLAGLNTTDFGPLASNLGTLADYRGTDRSIGKMERFGGGVRFFTPEQAALFSVPTAGSTGNSGRNTFRTPGFFSTDLSVVKQFRLKERLAVTFRAEAYNLLNTVNLLAPQTFGVISGTPTGAANQSGPRILQGAPRFDFQDAATSGQGCPRGRFRQRAPSRKVGPCAQIPAGPRANRKLAEFGARSSAAVD